MHNRSSRPGEALERARNQLSTRLGEHLNRHVFGNEVLLNQLPDKIEIRLRGSREADFDLFEPDLHEMLEHPELPRRVHGLNQRLIAITKVDAAPGGRGGDYPAGPGTVGDVDGIERAILV